MDDRDKEDEPAATSVHVSDSSQDNARLTESDTNHDGVPSGSTQCGSTTDVPTRCWDSYRFTQNIKIEDELQESTEDDNASSQQRHSVDGLVGSGLERMVCDDEQEFNEQKRVAPTRSTDQVSTWTHGVDEIVTVKQETNVDDCDGEDARRWFVCEAGELREVTAGQTEGVSPARVDEDCGEDVDQTQQRSSTTDNNHHQTQRGARSDAGPSRGASSTKSRRLRIYDRSNPHATVHRDLSTNDFSMLAQKRQKKYAKRNELTLQNKLDLIKAAAESGKSSRQLANEFHIGRTQACRILKRKSELLREIEQTNCLNRKRGLQKTANKDVNVICWEWFQTARTLNIPVSGAMLQEKALRCARHLGNTDFKASNGWLESFRRRHGISFSVKSGVTSDVSNDVIDEWQQRIPPIADAYKAEDVSKSNNTELFHRTSSDSPQATESRECEDGNRTKDLETVDIEPDDVRDHGERCLITSDEDALKWVGELTKYGQQTNDTVLCNMVADIKTHLVEKLSSRRFDDS